jgi:hypothetical protein
MASPAELSGLESLQQKQLRELQSIIDKSSNYSRMVLGLGYGGYFAAWAGTKQYLPPKRMRRNKTRQPAGHVRVFDKSGVLCGTC